MKFCFSKKRTISINFDKGCIDSIFVKKELIFKEFPLFSVKFRKKDNSSFVVTAFDSKLLNLDKNCALYQSEFFSLNLFFRKTKDGINFKTKIINKTDDVIEWVEIAPVGLSSRLIDEGGEGRILFPYNEGAIVTNLQRRLSSPFPYIEPEYPSLGKYCIFPNMLCAQMISYLSPNGSIYYGMHDKERGTKHIDFNNVDGALKLICRSYTGSNYGEDYQTDFETALNIFEGDEYDALDFYKSFFNSNLPNGLKKIYKNQMLPKWYKESPVVLAYPIRGHFDTDEMKPNKFYPYLNQIPVLKRFEKDLDSKIMGLLMHYEGTAPWAPPYVWPPYGGIDEFNEFVNRIHNNGLYVGLYSSGLGYTLKSNLVDNYSKYDEYEKDKIFELACSNSDGTIKSLICEAQRSGVDLCPALDKTKQLVANEYNKIINSGVDYVQVLDQNHGGCSYFCYSDKHGHPPVPGSWQQKETNSLIDKFSIPNGTLIGCESGASEPFLTKLKFSDNRFNLNYYIGLPFPMYSYLFHEYVNNFMGNQICMTLSKEPYNYSYRVSYSFICGDMLTAVINDDGEIVYSWCDMETTDYNNSITILKNLNAWRQGITKDHLHYGKMIRPVPLKCNNVQFKCEDSTLINVDGVQSSAYIFKNKAYQFIVNFQTEPITITLDKKYKLYSNPYSKNSVKTNIININALSCVIIKL